MGSTEKFKIGDKCLELSIIIIIIIIIIKKGRLFKAERE